MLFLEPKFLPEICIDAHFSNVTPTTCLDICLTDALSYSISAALSYPFLAQAQQTRPQVCLARLGTNSTDWVVWFLPLLWALLAQALRQVLAM